MSATVRKSMQALAVQMSLEDDPQVVKLALQFYTQTNGAAASTRGHTATATVACLELAGKRLGKSVDRRQAVRLCGSSPAEYQAELNRLGGRIAQQNGSQASAQVTLNSLVVQFGCPLLLESCERVMQTFREGWSAGLPPAQLAAVRWQRAVFPAGVFLACCKAANLRIDRNRLLTISGEKIAEINKVVALAEYYAETELSTVKTDIKMRTQQRPSAMPTPAVKPVVAKVGQAPKTKSASVSVVPTATVSVVVPAKPRRGRLSSAKNKPTVVSGAPEPAPTPDEPANTPAEQVKPRRGRPPGSKNRPRTASEASETAIAPEQPKQQGKKRAAATSPEPSQSTVESATQEGTELPEAEDMDTDPTDASPDAATDRAKRQRTPRRSRRTVTAESMLALESDERVLQLRAAPVDGVNPMISPVSWTQTPRYVSSMKWRDKLLQKIQD